MILTARSWIPSLAFVSGRGGWRRVSLRSPLALLAGIVLVASALDCSPARADNAVTKCGTTISKTYRSRYNAQNTITSGSFVNLPQAGVTVKVPAGQFQCVVVRFSAIVSCITATNIDHCYFRVTDNDNSFSFLPAGAVYSSDSGYASHSFEFVAVLNAGSHTLRIQTATGGGSLIITSWTFAVEVSEAL